MFLVLLLILSQSNTDIMKFYNQEEVYFNFIGNEYISLQELTDKLNFSDSNSTQKWLKSKDIPTEKRGRHIIIYKWEIDFALKKEAALRLKEQYPLNWHKIFEAGCTDENMRKAIFSIIPPTSNTPKVNNDFTKTTRNYIK